MNIRELVDELQDLLHNGVDETTEVVMVYFDHASGDKRRGATKEIVYNCYTNCLEMVESID